MFEELLFSSIQELELNLSRILQPIPLKLSKRMEMSKWEADFKCSVNQTENK